METWKDIPGYEGLYEASTHGRIRSADGKTTHTEKHGMRRWKSRILKGRGEHNINGYRVSLWKDGSAKDWLVCRLVGITFLGDPPRQDWTINHIDGNRRNNSVDNLEWLTLADNIRHGFNTGLYSNCQRGVVLSNKGESFDFKSMSEAGREIGRTGAYISECLKRGYRAKSIDGSTYDITPF